MKTIGIIAEFNPLHKGHAYFINEARRLSGADHVVVIMSGDYVQRGEPAVWNKFVRAEAAVFAGADLVLELPVRAATASAAFFAGGAVSILDSLGCIDELWFGSESGDLRLFDLFSDILCRETPAFTRILKEHLKEGKSFPAARSSAMEHVLENMTTEEPALLSVSDFINAPNNILGLEYCIALKKANSAISPRTLKRSGAGYHDLDVTVPFPSASAIRKMLYAEKTEADGARPVSLFPSFFLQNFPVEDLLRHTVSADDFSLLLQARLLKETRESLLEYLEMTPALADRILEQRNAFTTFPSFALLLKTRNTTYTHICRCLLHIVLGLKKEAPAVPAFVRILALRKENPLLGKLKAGSSLKLCARPAELKTAGYEEDLFASNLYEAVSAQKYGTPFVHEYSRCLTAVEP